MITDHQAEFINSLNPTRLAHEALECGVEASCPISIEQQQPLLLGPGLCVVLTVGVISDFYS